jgi:hypothetical protein
VPLAYQAHEAANNVGDRAFFFYAAVAKNVLVEVDEQIGCWTGASQQGRRNSLTTLPGGLYAGEAWLGYRKQYGSTVFGFKMLRSTKGV